MAGAAARPGYTSTPPSRISPPANCWISSAARREAISAISGSAPRSNRYDASVRRPSALDARRTLTGSNHAASSSKFRLANPISLSAPPITPAIPTACAPSAITHMSFPSVRSAASSVRTFSAAQIVQVVGVHRLPELEHHVVRHIHDVVDRVLPDCFQPQSQPLGGGLHFHPAHHPRRESPAKFRCLDFHARGTGHLSAGFLEFRRQ